MTLHVHRPSAYSYRAIARCRKCKRRTRHVMIAYLYYEPRAKCCAHDRLAARCWPELRAYDSKAMRSALDFDGAFA